MNDRYDELPQKVALFRYGVISDLIHLKPGHRGLYALLEEKADKDYDIPGSRRSRIAPETIRGWLKKYRKRGFDGLVPKRRRDHGESHSIPKPIQDLLVTLKEDNPDYSVSLVIDEARKTGSVDPDLALPPSTVHRLLARNGLMKKCSENHHKDHRRFAFANAGDFWMSDVMHGPSVVGAKMRKRKTYLIAFIDDATRVT